MYKVAFFFGIVKYHPFLHGMLIKMQLCIKGYKKIPAGTSGDFNNFNRPKQECFRPPSLFLVLYSLLLGSIAKITAT